MVLMYGDYRATVMLPPYTPAPAKLNPKATHISPSKITTHFGSHSNHFVPHHIQKPSLTPSPSQTQKTSPIQSSRNPEMFSGLLFSYEMRLHQVKAFVRFFPVVARRSSVMMFRFPSLTPLPPKLFTPSPQPRATCFTSEWVAGWTRVGVRESLPPPKCFLCMELFVLLLGVGYSFSSTKLSHPATDAILDSRNVVYRKDK